MKNMKKKIAIIGAATGQLPLCLKAKDMGLETYCFAWSQGAVCKDYVDHYVPVSIFDMDTIVKYCEEWCVDGVVSNASESTALVASYVAEKLGKVGTPYQAFKNIQNKAFVRENTNGIQELAPVRYKLGNLEELLATFPRPYVLKPIKGAAKKGVNYVDLSVKELSVPDDLKDAVFMAESYVEGKEYSVESISYYGQHQVIQITEKTSTGAPHFVELGHHQPAQISYELRAKVERVVPKILSSLGFTNGATHIEIKINDAEEIFLIEVNPRGGGDEISNTLVMLSTGYDYLKSLIEVALDIKSTCCFKWKKHAGIYYLCQQSTDWLNFFKEADFQPWLIEKSSVNLLDLHKSISNYDRDGYVAYCWNRKIDPLLHSDLCVRRLNDMPNKYELAHDFLLQLKAETTNHHYDIPESWVEKILSKGDVLVYADKGIIQGWIVFYCNDYIRKYAYVAGLHVLLGYRRNGIARILLEYAITICQDRNFNVLSLYCNNPTAMKLYNEYGFKNLGEKPMEQYGGDVYSYLELDLRNYKCE